MNFSAPQSHGGLFVRKVIDASQAESGRSCKKGRAKLTVSVSSISPAKPAPLCYLPVIKERLPESIIKITKKP